MAFARLTFFWFRHAFLRVLTGLCIALYCLGSVSNTFAATKPLEVVTSFSILEDLVKQVGGEQVNVTNLVKAGNDAHAYEPSAQDAKMLAKADLLFINGLEFEPWIERLKKASGFQGKEIVVSNDVTPRRFNAVGDHAHDDHDHDDEHDHGEFDPHAWQNVNNAIIYVQNIELALREADPENAAVYRERAQVYIRKLWALDSSIRDAFEVLPSDRRTIATTHESFGYFADTYGFKLVTIMGMSPDEEPTAASIAQFIKEIKAQHINAIFLENITNTRLLEQIARDTGVKVGGTLYSDALSAPGTVAQSYLEMMQSNRDTLVDALNR